MKSPALFLALVLTIYAGGVKAAGDVETSASWRFWELHMAPKPAPLIPPAMSAAQRAACGDINAADWQCAEPGPELMHFRTSLETRRRALEQKLDHMTLYPQTYDGADFQLALTQSGLSQNQIPAALMRKIKTTRFVVAWRGSLRNRPRKPYFPY